MLTFFPRTILLSLSVFWRMLIIMPLFFLIVGALSFAIAMYVPIIGVFIASIMVAISVMFLSFLCLRAGLAATAGVGPMDFGRLVAASIKYGLFLTIISGIAGLMASGIIAVLYKNGFRDAAAGLGQYYTTGASDLLSLNPAFLIGLGFYIIATSALYAAMVIPMTATAAAKPGDAKPDFFEGAGVNFISLVILFLIASILTTQLGAIGKGVVFLFSMAELVMTGGLVEWADAASSEGLELAGTISELLVSFGFLMLAIWLYCLQYSGGVIAYLNFRDRVENTRQGRVRATQSDPEAARNLRKNRGL